MIQFALIFWLKIYEKLCRGKVQFKSIRRETACIINTFHEKTFIAGLVQTQK